MMIIYQTSRAFQALEFCPLSDGSRDTHRNARAHRRTGAAAPAHARRDRNAQGNQDNLFHFLSPHGLFSLIITRACGDFQAIAIHSYLC